MNDNDPATQRVALPAGNSAKSRRHWWLMLIPYLWCIAAIPLVNQVDYVFGNVPFLLVWMIAGVLISSVCISVVYFVDRRNGTLERI